MDSVRVHEVLRPLIIGLKDMSTHDELPAMCEKLGLPVPDTDGSKAERMSGSFDKLPDVDLPRVAARFLELHPPAPCIRNEIQDLLWADAASPERQM